MKVSGTLVLYAAAALALGGLAFVVIRKGSDLAGAWTEKVDNVAQAVNPTNPDNVFAQGSNTLAQKISGDPTVTFGSWIYDLTHPNANDAVAPTPLPLATVTPSAASVLPMFDAPTLPDFPTVFDKPATFTGPGGAAFGLYPNPFRSK